MNRQRKRVLISDCDDEVLIALERLLEDAGFDTTTACSTSEALDLLRMSEFDLVLAADHPPELNCEAILRLAQAKQVPVVGLETRPRHPFAEAYLLSLGASRIVHKWDHQQIRNAANELLFTLPGERAKSAVAASGHLG